MHKEKNLGKTWAAAVRSYAASIITTDDGKTFQPIGARVLAFLSALWNAERPQAPDIGALIQDGSDIRFWADPHFGHDNIRRLCDRHNFASVDDMDREIMANVSDAMAASRLVVCLGDLALKESITVQKRLRRDFGQKHLHAIGNHDPKGSTPEDWLRLGAFPSLAFALPLPLLQSWVREDHGELAELVDWGRLPATVHFGCAHWPIPPEALPDQSWLCLHGHTHHRNAGPLRLNCSVEVIDYRPAQLRDLLTPEVFDDLAQRQH